MAVGEPWYTPKWSYAAALMRTRLPQIASFVPIFGYAVLFSDQFQNLLMTFGALDARRCLTPTMRIYLLYFGSVLILAGCMLFWGICWHFYPLRHRTRPEYIDAVQASHDREETKRAWTGIEAVIPSGTKGAWLIHGVLLTDVDTSRMKGRTGDYKARASELTLAAFYEVCDRERPILCTGCLGLLIVGGFMFLLPAGEVFYLAMTHAIEHLLGRMSGEL